MVNTFNVISRTFGSKIEREFKETDVWQASFTDVRLKLNECMSICTQWKKAMNYLTKIAWRQQQMNH